MDYNEKYELVLNHISHGEQVLRNEKDYEEYRQMAYLFLNHKGKHLFEEDILSHFSQNMTLEKILAQNPGQYVQGANMPNPKKAGKREKTWYNTWDTEYIEPEDDFFDYFFACKLRQVDLLDVDGFLNYQLEKKFDGDSEKFKRFLLVVLRKHKNLLGSEVMETANEWMTGIAPKPELSGTKASEIKGKLKVKRESGDGLTCLNLEQTALLIRYLQKSKLILKDEYLNNKQAGQAFSILTGYSPDTIRQQLGFPVEIMGTTLKNVKEIHNAITRLIIMIEKDLK